MDSKEETEKYCYDRENKVYMKNALDKKNKMIMFSIENPTVVISSYKYTTCILVSELKTRILATYDNLDKLDENYLNNFKYVVFILDTLSKKDIISFIKTANLRAKIIFITENSFPSIIFKHNLKNKNYYKFYFLSAFKVRFIPIVFNREEPSKRTIISLSKK